MKTTLVLLLLLPVLAFAGATIDFGPGTYDLGTISINDKVVWASLAVDRELWTDPKVRAFLKISLNTNPNWICEAASEGGVIPQTPITNVSCFFPPGTGRQLTGTLVVTGGTLSVKVKPSFSTKEQP